MTPTKEQLDEKAVARFWSKVDRRGVDECWPWTAGIHARSGRALPYGYFSIGGSGTKSHRVAFVIAHGEIPPGMVVRHTCDNAACVNPAPLTLGTQNDNVRDRERRGRGRHHFRPGEGHPGHVLTESQVIAAKSMRRAGAAYSEIAESLNITVNLVDSAVRAWRWLD